MTPSEKLDLGQAVRAERLRQGVSQFRLAVKAGASPASVGLAEAGACSPAMLARLAKALGIKVPRNGTTSQAGAR